MSLKDPLTGVPIVKRLRTNEFYKSIFAVLCTGDAIIAKLESRGSRGFREISDFELELASASL